MWQCNASVLAAHTLDNTARVMWHRACELHPKPVQTRLRILSGVVKGEYRSGAQRTMGARCSSGLHRGARNRHTHPVRTTGKSFEPPRPVVLRYRRHTSISGPGRTRPPHPSHSQKEKYARKHLQHPFAHVEFNGLAQIRGAILSVYATAWLSVTW